MALGFGIGTPEQARRAADAGADGVIVGTRLVRAAGARIRGPGRRRRGGRRANWPQGSGGPGRIRARMGLILTVTAGLVVWIVLWAISGKGLDAFLLPPRSSSSAPR